MRISEGRKLSNTFRETLSRTAICSPPPPQKLKAAKPKRLHEIVGFGLGTRRSVKSSSSSWRDPGSREGWFDITCPSSTEAKTNKAIQLQTWNMAALIIVAGLAIADKVEKKKEAKRLKKERDEIRYRELQVETNKRNFQKERNSNSNALENSSTDPYVEPEQGEDEGTASEEQVRTVLDQAPPPPYEDVVAIGEMREREWRAQMQRRRSSVQSPGGVRVAS